MRIDLGLGLPPMDGGGGEGGGGGGYEGPLDLVPGAAVAYSAARALSAAWLGQPLFTLRRSSDNAELSFVADAVTGEAPSAAIEAWRDAAGAAVAALKIWNDQSGNGEDIETGQYTAIWGSSVQGGKPGFVASELTVFQSATDASFPNGAATVFFVCSNAMQFKCGASKLEFDTGSTPYVLLNDETNTAGGEIGAPAPGLYLWEAAWEFGSKSFRINGVSQTFVEDGDSGGSVGPLVGTSNINFSLAASKAVELVAYAIKLSDANRLAIRQNIATYYGIEI